MFQYVLTKLPDYLPPQIAEYFWRGGLGPVLLIGLASLWWLVRTLASTYTDLAKDHIKTLVKAHPIAIASYVLPFLVAVLSAYFWVALACVLAAGLVWLLSSRGVALVRRKWVPSALVLTFITGACSIEWISRQSSGGPNVFVILAFENKGGGHKEKAFESWQRICSTVATAFADILWMRFEPRELSAETFDNLSDQHRATEEVVKYLNRQGWRPNIVLRTTVTIEEDGPPHAITLVSNFHVIEGGKLRRHGGFYVTGAGMFDDLEHLALSVVFDLYQTLKEVPDIVFEEEEESLVRANLLEAFLPLAQLRAVDGDGTLLEAVTAIGPDGPDDETLEALFDAYPRASELDAFGRDQAEKRSSHFAKLSVNR